MQSDKWIVRYEEAVRRQAQAGNSRSISNYWVVKLTIRRLVTEEHSTSESDSVPMRSTAFPVRDDQQDQQIGPDLSTVNRPG
jgi:hypothetical protein